MNSVVRNRVKLRDSENADLEEAIVLTLQTERAEISILDMLERLCEQGFEDEAKVKATITRLLAESKIEMTPQRKLQISVQARWYS